MGADIAGWCVACGMEVTLQDLTPEQIEKGIEAQRQAVCAQVQDQAAARRGESASDRRSQAATGIARADVVIEAIVEKLEVKQALFKEIEGKLKPGAVLATNTSSLQIEDIAAPLADPGRLIGIHFFNPVAQMPLVEVVRGATSREDEVKQGRRVRHRDRQVPADRQERAGLPRQPRARALHDGGHAAGRAKARPRKRSTKRRAHSACRWGRSSWPTRSGSTCAPTSARS